MYRYVRGYSEVDNIFGMTMIRSENMDKSRTGGIDINVYVSDMQASHGPRLKFDGGSKETRRGRNAPSYPFNSKGLGDGAILEPWMNKKNCPNAFNKDVLESIREFIDRLLPLLLLNWYGFVDPDICEKYITGNVNLKSVLSNLVENAADYASGIDDIDAFSESAMRCSTMGDLYAVCSEYGLIS